MLCIASRSVRDDPLDRLLAAHDDPTEKLLPTRRPGEEEMQSRLNDLQAAIREAKLDWYIVPSEDEHLSEYIAETEKRREWISNFNGSAGTAIIPASTDQAATLFLDSRYWVIGENQIPKQGWRVERVGSTGQAGRGSVQSGWTSWLVDGAEDGSRIGIDPRLVSSLTAKSILKQLEDSGSSTKLVSIDENLVDRVRAPEPRSLGPITPHPMKYAGETSKSKIDRMRETFSNRLGWHSGDTEWIYVLPSLPSIAWLLNCRCRSDVPECPAPYSYLVLTADECALFADQRKVTDELRSALDESGVAVRPYGIHEVGKYVKEVQGQVRARDEKAQSKVWGSPEVSWGLDNACGGKVEVIECPIDLAKAIKNPVELQGFRNCYLRDGRAMVRWFAWLENKLMKDNRDIGEFAAGQALARFRSKEDLYVSGGSGISASGPNAASPHYVPERCSDLRIDREAPFLVDSGTQYEDASIDTTRTVYFGKSPSDDIKRAYTRVLQCHMNVLKSVFPRGSNADQLIMLGKAPLYQDGMDFGHGLGHGVGSFLGVHETPYFPHGRSFEPGHVITVEPGFYKEGEFGIRTESLVCCKEVDTKYEFGGHRWLGWERITQVPIQTKLIDWSLLVKSEIEWINAHNTAVQEALMPLLEDEEDKEVREYVKRECKPKRIWPWTGA